MTDRKFTTPTGEEVDVSEEGFISVDVVLCLSDIIHNDLEGFLDMLSMAATDTDILSEIHYTMNKVNNLGGLEFTVTGSIEFIRETDHG